MIRCVFWEWLCHISVTVKFLSDSLTLHIIFNPHAVSSPATLISPCSWRALVSGEGCWTKLLVSIGLLLLLLVSSVLYLPAAAAGCLRECGGVRRGDSPRSGGVGLGLLGLCCCLKNGLSKRPGGRRGRRRRRRRGDDTQPHTKIQTHQHETEEETRRRSRTERMDEKTRQTGESSAPQGDSQKQKRIVGKSPVETQWRRKRETWKKWRIGWINKSEWNKKEWGWWTQMWSRMSEKERERERKREEVSVAVNTPTDSMQLGRNEKLTGFYPQLRVSVTSWVWIMNPRDKKNIWKLNKCRVKTRCIPQKIDSYLTLT